MSKEKILIFGGNGFIGAETVEYLLNNYEDKYELILVNRGNWDDWDSKIRIKDRIKTNIICDRKHDYLDEKLKDYLKEDDLKFYAIIDFSGLKPHFIREVIKYIPHEKINMYIYISTDSVYEVSDTSGYNYETDLLRESDSVRPESRKEIDRLKDFDSYGHEKLRCEEILIENAKFPYIILRLPDVIGARDSTNRFWFYQMLLQYMNASQHNGESLIIPVPAYFYNRKTSYVYVKDIARLIAHLLQSNIKNEIFNIGFDEHLTLIELLKLIAFEIKPGFEQKITFKEEKNCDFKHGFPSVTKGPIDTSKCKNVLRFQFSKFEEVIKETVKFYNSAYKLFTSERKLTVKDLCEDVFSNDERCNAFKQFVRNYDPFQN